MNKKINKAIEILEKVYLYRQEHHDSSWEIVEMSKAKDFLKKLDTLKEIPQKKWTDEMWNDFYEARVFAKNNNVTELHYD